METEPQREPPAEIPLPGGQLTPGIVRVGNTVRRLRQHTPALLKGIVHGNRHPVFHQVEIDQTLWYITFHDEAGQPVDPLQVTLLVDRATSQVLNCWLEAPAAPPSEEPPTLP